MFETLDEKTLLDLSVIDNSIKFSNFSGNRVEILNCLNEAAIECSVQKANVNESPANLQQIVKGLIAAQNIVNGAFHSYENNDNK